VNRLVKHSPLLGLLLLSGCLLGPDYERPAVETPEQYSLESEGESVVNFQWWEIFADPEMQTLIRLALEENRDLRSAIARIEETRARLGFVRADQFPTLDGQAGANRGNTAEQFFPGAGVNDFFTLGVALSYEVDFWGKYRRASESARAELLASVENQRSVLITLIADVASAYLLLRDIDNRTVIAEDTVQARRESTALIRARFDKGIVALLDVNQAEIQEADAMARLAQLRRETIETENLLSVLVGSNPRAILRGRNIAEQIFPPEIPAGLPSSLLERRPDIRAAEQQLAAQTARIGAAQALRFPSVTLTGNLGLVSNDLSDLLDGDSELWGIGVDILGPIFDAGKRRSQVEEEVARTEQALNAYEQTILQAMREVEDALAGIRYYREESEARDFQVQAAQSAKDLSWARYDGGVSDYLLVLDSDRSLFNAQLEASSVRRQQLVSIVQLYKALGGGWIPPESESTEVTEAQ
jgi:multidrug efflux system outer membrane protein